MKDLVERYIYDVTRRLPETSREEVSKELRANIEDMLSEKPTEEEIEKVLTNLGNPRLLANEYRGSKRYLVGPEWMDDYLEVLKYVSIVVGSLTLIFGLLDVMDSLGNEGIFLTILQVSAQVIAEVFGSLCQVFAIITVIFALITHFNKKEGMNTWGIKCLPDLPEKQTVKFSKAGAIAEIIVTLVFGIAWIYVLYNHLNYIGWYNDADGWHLIAPLFTDSVITPLIPMFVVSLAISLVSGAVKLTMGHWNFWVAAVNTLDQAVNVIVMFVLIGQVGLFHPDFINLAATEIGISSAEFLNNLTQGISGFFVFITVMISFDVISGWVKAFKGQKEVK